MKAKTIKSVLRKKIDDWIDSIPDEELKKAINQDVIVTGGCITSMLLKEPVNDYDVYFRTKETTEKVTRYYVEWFNSMSDTKHKNGAPVNISWKTTEDRVKIIVKSAGIATEGETDDYQYFEGLDDAQDVTTGEYVERIMEGVGNVAEETTPVDDKPKYRPVFLSSNAITLSDKLQIVIRFFGEPDEIHSNYDFCHCTNYWTSHDNHLELKAEALECILARELRYVGSKYPLCSLIRIRKFIRRGWTINAGQMLKAIMQLNTLDLTNLEILEEQLIGVDAAYFSEVIYKLKSKDQTTVDNAYLMEIIDRMF